MKFLYRAFAVLTNSQSIRKKLFVGYSLYRDSMCLNLIPIKARFSISKSGYVKNSNRGAMLIEFIPFSEDPMDPNKKILALKSKKIISLADNHIFKLVTFTEKLLELNRNNKFDEKTLYISKKDLEFKWKLVSTNKNTDKQNVSEVLVTSSEFSMIQRFCNYSLPEIQGWQLLENIDYAHGLSMQANNINDES